VVDLLVVEYPLDGRRTLPVRRLRVLARERPRVLEDRVDVVV